MQAEIGHLYIKITDLRNEKLMKNGFLSVCN